jgi:aminoglycoside phosphotransferase
LLSSRPQHGTVFIHGDACAGNVLIDRNGSYLALIDWGGAGWDSLEAECARLEDDALELAKQRWGNELNLGLVEQLRLELYLQVLIQCRIGTEAVREQLEIAAEYA